MRRSMQVVSGAGVIALALVGCGAVPADQAASDASRAATGSHLVNASGVPIVYSVGGSAALPELPPGGAVTSSDGAWQVPPGWVCTWRFTKAAQGSGTTTVGPSASPTWTTFGGYDETVTACTGPAS